MNIFVLGRKYQGKSTLAIYLGRQIKQRFNGYKLLVFDPKWQIRIFPHSSNVSQFKALLHDNDAEGVTYFAGEKFDKNSDDSEQVQKDFSEFCEAIEIESHLRRPPERPIIIIIDEVYYLQGKGYLHPWLGRMIRLATEGRLYIIQVGHRPVDLTPDVRGKGDEFFIFRQTDFTDLRIVGEIAGEDSAAIVENLPLHHVLRYDVNRQVSEVWNEPELWYSEISKEPKQHDEFDAVRIR